MRLLAAIVLWLFYFYPIVYYGIDRKITEKGAITSMHELGVVFHIIDDLKEVAVNNEISEITKVVLELGSIIGEAVGEDLVNEIFSKFCTGK